MIQNHDGNSPPVFRRGRFGVAETGVVAARLAGTDTSQVI